MRSLGRDPAQVRTGALIKGDIQKHGGEDHVKRQGGDHRHAGGGPQRPLRGLQRQGTAHTLTSHLSLPELR